MASCEKELDFKYNDIEPLTVIEAEITPDGAKVGITLTTPMDEPMDRSHLTDAVVTLTDLTDGTVYDLSVDAEGFFTDPTPVLSDMTTVWSWRGPDAVMRPRPRCIRRLRLKALSSTG